MSIGMCFEDDRDYSNDYYKLRDAIRVAYRNTQQMAEHYHKVGLYASADGINYANHYLKQCLQAAGCSDILKGV